MGRPKEILTIEDIFEGANEMLDEINVDNDTIIQWIIDKTLQSQLKERNYRYCPYCSHLLSHRVDTDANTKLVCKYALCPTKTQNQTKDEN